MLENLKQELKSYATIAGNKGLTPGISGNISARYNDKVLITTSGSANGYLDDEDLVLIDFNGDLVDGATKASTEKYLHLEYYRRRDDINAIFHVHSPYLTAFASAQVALTDGISPEIIYCFGEIPLAEYAIPGSQELVDKTAKFFDNYDVVMLANHGVIVGGKSIKDAFLKLDLAENYAKTIICTKFLGGAKILPEEEIKKIYSLR